MTPPPPAPFLDADVAPPSRAFPQRLNETGADVARLSFPRLPQRRKTVEVTLGEGQTVGELVCKYVGEYTEENMNLTREMNRGRLDDLDFVVPGTVIKLADNRKPKLATPEAEWWNERGMGAAPREAAAARPRGTLARAQERLAVARPTVGGRNQVPRTQAHPDARCCCCRA